MLDFDYPLMFDNSRKVARLYEILGKCLRKSYLYELPSLKSKAGLSFGDVFSSE